LNRRQLLKRVGAASVASILPVKLSQPEEAQANETFDVEQPVLTEDEAKDIANFSLVDFDRAIDSLRFAPAYIVLSPASVRRLYSLLQAHQRDINMTTIEGGWKIMTYRDLPVIRAKSFKDGVIGFGFDKREIVPRLEVLYST
jgi:hypothetical protein